MDNHNAKFKDKKAIPKLDSFDFPKYNPQRVFEFQKPNNEMSKEINLTSYAQYSNLGNTKFNQFNQFNQPNSISVRNKERSLQDTTKGYESPVKVFPQNDYKTKIRLNKYNETALPSKIIYKKLSIPAYNVKKDNKRNINHNDDTRKFSYFDQLLKSNKVDKSDSDDIYEKPIHQKRKYHKAVTKIDKMEKDLEKIEEINEAYEKNHKRVSEDNLVFLSKYSEKFIDNSIKKENEREKEKEKEKLKVYFKNVNLNKNKNHNILDAVSNTPKKEHYLYSASNKKTNMYSIQERKLPETTPIPFNKDEHINGEFSLKSEFKTKQINGNLLSKEQLEFLKMRELTKKLKLKEDTQNLNLNKHISRKSVPIIVPTMKLRNPSNSRYSSTSNINKVQGFNHHNGHHISNKQNIIVNSLNKAAQIKSTKSEEFNKNTSSKNVDDALKSNIYKDTNQPNLLNTKETVVDNKNKLVKHTVIDEDVILFKDNQSSSEIEREKEKNNNKLKLKRKSKFRIFCCL